MVQKCAIEMGLADNLSHEDLSGFPASVFGHSAPRCQEDHHGCGNIGNCVWGIGKSFQFGEVDLKKNTRLRSQMSREAWDVTQWLPLTPSLLVGHFCATHKLNLGGSGRVSTGWALV